MLLTMNVRVSTDPADVDAVMAIVASFGAPEDVLPKIRAVVEAELAELGGERLLFVGEEGGVPIAAAQLIFGSGQDPHVHALQVRRTHRRRGVGSTIMRAIEDHVRRARGARLTLSVDVGNAPALALYAALGYELVSEAPGRAGTPVRLLCKQL